MRAGLVGRLVGEILVRRPARGRATVVLRPPGRADAEEGGPKAEFAAAAEFAGMGDAAGGPAAEPAPDTLVVIFPGAALAPEQYEPLAEAIQRKSEVDGMWVIVPKFIGNWMLGERAAQTVRTRGLASARPAAGAGAGALALTPAAARTRPQALSECVRLVARGGFRFDPAYASIGGGARRGNAPPETDFWMSRQLFLVGHSWGGFMMRPLALEKAAGAVFLNSFLGESHDYSAAAGGPVSRALTRAMMQADAVYPTSIGEWPKPVMLLTGDRDGQMRMSYAAEASHRVDQFRKGANALPEHAQADKSVVVIAGLNHSKHVRGAAPNLRRGDTEAAFGGEVAVGKCADAVAAFLDANLLRSPLARSIVRNFEGDSRLLLGPMLMAGIGGSERGQLRELAQVCQKRAANVQGLTSGSISVREFSDLRLFTYSKPAIVASGPAQGTDEWRVEVCAHRVLRDAANGGRNNSRNRLGDELWLKMKSQEALLAPPLRCARAGDPADARGINEFTLKRALEIVTADQRERYLRRGRPLRFGADIEMAAGPSWLRAPIEYEYAGPGPEEDAFGPGAVVVRCPTGTSPAAGVPERFAGMHYMKLPSFALMVEYVLVDAFMDIEALPYVASTPSARRKGAGRAAGAPAAPAARAPRPAEVRAG